jgi:hypothetical protein
MFEIGHPMCGRINHLPIAADSQLRTGIGICITTKNFIDQCNRILPCLCMGSTEEISKTKGKK